MLEANGVMFNDQRSDSYGDEDQEQKLRRKRGGQDSTFLNEEPSGFGNRTSKISNTKILPGVDESDAAE